MKKFQFKLDKKSDREIIKLAWPSIIEQILEMMVGMVSTIFMGRIGASAVAAVGMINMLMGFLQTVFSGLSMGTTVIIARVTGEGNKKEAKRALIQSIYMALFVGVILLIFGKMFSNSLLHLFFGKAKRDVLNIGLGYFSIILFNLPFFVVDIIVSGAMRGAGDTKTPMFITGGVNVLNVILNTMLVFGVQPLGIPAMGVTGSAIAVTISRIVAVTIRILVLYNLKGLKLNLNLKDDYRIKIDLMKRIINVGVPAFLEQAVMQGGFLVLEIIIVTMGTVAMAAYQVGINVNSLAFFPIFGLAIANTTLVGQSLGEKNYKKAEKYAYEGLKIAMIVAFIIGISMCIFARQLAYLYTNDKNVIDESVGIIRTFGIIEPMLAILNLCSAALKAAGDINYVMITSFVGLWSGRVFLSFALNGLFGMGMFAIMIGIFVDFSSRSFMYLGRMNKGKWKYLKV
ncbi:MATE family efflux transporter [Clostridium oryzae]|uniref:Probable multidrug resistance protein NorM n=1 Tax=Clostridium oryzae TaxID=1450648 RepID=A0A1V4I9K9_9CLOT|nr:MATE family efflux transporter [Clostridium oryzae]OPJ56672.1 multidrug resistance protein NorM [Clostridium oryzae]